MNVNFPPFANTRERATSHIKQEKCSWEYYNRKICLINNYGYSHWKFSILESVRTSVEQLIIRKSNKVTGTQLTINYNRKFTFRKTQPRQKEINEIFFKWKSFAAKWFVLLYISFINNIHGLFKLNLLLFKLKVSHVVLSN